MGPICSSKFWAARPLALTGGPHKDFHTFAIRIASNCWRYLKIYEALILYFIIKVEQLLISWYLPPKFIFSFEHSRSE